ncbi:MAG: zinc ribbon domain-containing protein [Sebaldella sp.]|nr:zinc ribbon domain-containing protein [Sebaldella sp.]
MYCVKCGVELERGRKECPLCKTKVMYEELTQEPEEEYPEVKINLYKMNKKKIKSRLYFIMLTLSVISILEVLLGNIAINGRLTWGYFVIPSLILTNIAVFIATDGWNLKKNLLLLSTSLTVFLLILDLYDEKLTWSVKIGIPIVISFFILGLIFSKIKKQKKSKIKVFNYFLILIGIFIISIEIIISGKISWSLLASIPLIVFGLMFKHFYEEYDEELEKRMHL